MTVNGRLVVTFHEVGLATTVAGLVLKTMGAAKTEISEGLLVHVRADWDIGEVELHPVFGARKVVDLVASSSVMIFPSGSRCAPGSLGPTGMALIDVRVLPKRVKPGK